MNQLCWKMAEGGLDERQSFGNYARSLKKYGTITNHVKKPPDITSYSRHEIEEGDTLQGLALKYGVSMEQIRRANRLWASDSLFVRETLLIPISLDDADSSGSTVLSPSGFSSHSADSGHSSDSSPDDHQGGSAILREAVPVRQGSSRRGSTRQQSVISDQSDSTLSDFLVKIDSSIARTKHQVEKIQGNSEFWTSDEYLSSSGRPSSRRKPAVSRLRQAGGSSNGASSSGLEVTTQGRKLRSSLQRLEQTQDQLFEL